MPDVRALLVGLWGVCVAVGCAQGQPIADHVIVLPADSVGAAPDDSPEASGSPPSGVDTPDDVAGLVSGDGGEAPAPDPESAPPASASEPADEAPDGDPLPPPESAEDEAFDEDEASPGDSGQAEGPPEFPADESGADDPELPDSAPEPPPALDEPEGESLPPNLLPDPGFETGPGDFSAAFGGVLEVSAAQARSGEQSLRVSARTETWQGAVVDLTARVEAGRSYLASVHALVDSAAPQSLLLTSRVGCAGLEDEFVTVATGIGDRGAWVELAGELTPPAASECELEDVLLYVEGPPAQFDLYVDDASLLSVTE